MTTTWRRVAAFALFALLARNVVGDNAINPSFAYGTEPVRGVNLGGWLVLEVCSPVVRFMGALLQQRLAMDHAQIVREHGQRQHCR